MIQFEEALSIVNKVANTISTEKSNIRNSLGRVLSENIYSDIDMPPFDKSAMDGYACKKSDLNNPLKIIEVIPAGKIPEKTVEKNQCSKIMTGALVPKGADTVIMIEHTKQIYEDTIQFIKENSKHNICRKGEDIKKGDIVLKKGTIICPEHIAVLASVGVINVPVYKKPKLSVISTGNELVEPNIKPNNSQIRNSNAFQLIAQAEKTGIEAEYAGIAEDTKRDTENKIKNSLKNADIVVISGAVSVGDYDFVPAVIKKLGFTVHFHGIKIKPGKRTILASKSDKYIIGVPGNPVSSFVQFEMLIKPLIYKICGANYKHKYIKLPLYADFKRKNTERKAFEPVIITEEGDVKKIEYHGSAHINSLSYADGLMIINEGVSELKKGELVNVRPI